MTDYLYRCSTLALLCIASPALAETASAEAEMADANTIVVTALRAPTPISQVGSSVTVIDKDEIEAAQAVVVSDLLARTPGISFSRNGGIGTTTALRIRGAETDHTVVVVDGVKFNDPSSPGGGYDFANMLAGDISRIEILRGPQSILWGSQAIGGVVNIVTAKPTRPLEGSIDIEGGSRSTVYARAGLGGASDLVNWRLAGGSYSTDGISALSPRAGGSERDGYTNRNLTGQAEVKLAENVHLDLRGFYTSADNNIDGFNFLGFQEDTPEYSTTREFVGYAGLNVDLLDGRFHNRVAYGYTSLKRASFDPRFDPSQTFYGLGRNERLEYQGTFDIAEGWTAVFGAENERSRMKTSSYGGPLNRAKARINSVYGQLQAEVLKGLTLTGGVRHDDHNSFGSSTQGAAAAAWALNNGSTILRASYSEGFKAPTLYQLFSDYGNVTLQPEKARGWDAGVEQHFLDGAIVLSATYFDRRSKNLIDFAYCPNPTTPSLCFIPGTAISRFGYYENIARTRAKGVEVFASAKLSDRLKIDANYTRTEAENRTPGFNFGNDLARRPRDTANASVSYDWPMGVETAVAVRYAGKSFNDAGNTTVLDDYTLVDFRVSVPVTDKLELYGRVENLFDEYYETVRNYNSLGRSFYAGLRARF